MNNKSKIGVFDSGIGGLTVLKELLKILPNEEYIYLADLKNSPYGEKSPEQIKSMAIKNIKFLIEKGSKIIVVACNTASSYYMEDIRAMFKTPILTVLEAAINSISNNDKKILLVATNATIKSGSYDQYIERKTKNIKLYKKACPIIVPSIENEDLDDSSIQDIVDNYIKEYKNKNIELLILGCTHYPIWVENFRKSIGYQTKILNPANRLANEVFLYLKDRQMLNSEETSSVKYFVTENKDKFFNKGKNLIKNMKLEDINKIEL